MKCVIDSGNVIKRIREGKDLEEIATYARNQIFQNGPKDTLVLEILAYLKLFQPTYFEKFESELIETMGLFFKNPTPDCLQGVVFEMYRQHINMTKISHRCKQVSLNKSKINSTLVSRHLPVLVSLSSFGI